MVTDYNIIVAKQFGAPWPVRVAVSAGFVSEATFPASFTY